MKIVINVQFGGFKRPPSLVVNSEYDYISRTDPALVAAVEAGENNDGKLAVYEIPDECFYFISEYDGNEDVYWSMTPIKSVRGANLEDEK